MIYKSLHKGNLIEIFFFSNVQNIYKSILKKEISLYKASTDLPKANLTLLYDVLYKRLYVIDKNTTN